MLDYSLLQVNINIRRACPQLLRVVFCDTHPHECASQGRYSKLWYYIAGFVSSCGVANVGKLGFVLSVIMVSVAVTSLIANVHLYIVNKQLNDEIQQTVADIEFGMYGYIYALSPGLENETQKRASTVWKEVKDSDEAKLVISEDNFSVIVYLHQYSVGGFDPSTAEWVLIISSTPENSNETKIATFRLDYQTLSLKKTYTSSYSVGDKLSLEESAAIMEEEMTRDPYGGRSVNSEKVKLFGGNYVYSYPAMDFGGTIIVNKYAGVAIFYATTVWDGMGRLIIPEE